MGYRRFAVIMPALAGLLKGSGHRYESDLPGDVEVCHVIEDDEYSETVIIIASSAEWEGPPEGGPIPSILVTVQMLD